MNDDFNDNLIVFIPKNVDNSTGIYNPADTRPLGLKNTDNKAIAAISNLCIKHTLAGQLCEDQRGFLCGRNFLQNVVDVDSIARLFSFDQNLSFP